MRNFLIIIFLFISWSLFAQADSTNVTVISNLFIDVANQLTAGTPAALITKTITTIAGILLVILKPWNWFKKKNKTKTN